MSPPATPMMRALILDMKRGGKALAEIAKEVGYDERTIRRWWYETEGIVPVSSSRELPNSRTLRRSSNRIVIRRCIAANTDGKQCTAKVASTGSHHRMCNHHRSEHS